MLLITEIYRILQIQKYINEYNSIYYRGRKMNTIIKAPEGYNYEVVDNKTVKLVKVYSTLDKIKDYIKNYSIKGYATNIEIIEGRISIALPNCNTEWTYAVWDWVQAFVKKYPNAYPEHDEDDGKHMFININFTTYEDE